MFNIYLDFDFLLSGNSRVTQMAPAALTYRQMVQSCGPGGWTTPSGRGISERGDNCNSMISLPRYFHSATAPPGSGLLWGE